MKRILCVVVISFLFIVSCNVLKKTPTVPKIQEILLTQEHHETSISFLPIDDSLSFKAPFQHKGDEMLLLNFFEMDPFKFFEQESTTPLMIQGHSLESNLLTDYNYDIRAIQSAHPQFQEERYQVPQWKLPIALVENFFLHFMLTKERITEVWLSSMDLKQFIFVDTADILTHTPDYEGMRVMLGQNNYFNYIDDGFFAYRKKDDIVLFNIFEYLISRELKPIILPGAGKNLYNPFSYDLHPFFKMFSDSRYICLQSATENKETIVYVVDKESKALINTLLLEETGYVNHHRIFFREELSIVLSSSLLDKTLKIYPLNSSKPHIIDLSVYDDEENDFLYSVVYASHNEQGWLFYLLPVSFQGGTKPYFYTLQLNADFDLKQISRYRWNDNDKYEHHHFFYQAFNKSWIMVSQLKDTDEYFLVETTLEHDPEEMQMNIYPLQLPVSPGDDKLQISYFSFSDKVFAFFNLDNPATYQSTSLYQLGKKLQ
jgi:hypothetical protein